MRITDIKTREEARQKAIEYQNWAMNKENLSYSDLILWSSYFENLGKIFNLTEEYRENGII